MPELPSEEDAFERLRRLENEPESGPSSRAYVLGKRWAMADAHPNELRRLEEFCQQNEFIRPANGDEDRLLDWRAAKQLFRDFTLSVLGYKERLRSVDDHRLFPADREQLQNRVKPFWTERVGVDLDENSQREAGFLNEFSRGALDFWQSAKQHL